MGVRTGGASSGLRGMVRIPSPLGRLVVPAFLALAVAAFSGLWRAGALVLDGPGMSLYVGLAKDYLVADGRVPYWVSEMWGGTPTWALVPSVPVLMLVPLAAAVGADVAVKIAILALQVVGGWGAFVLARSLWGRTPAALVAGLVYALHPLFVAQGALGGSETSAAVMAAVPWFTWSLAKGLRGEGRRYLVAAGLVSALAVLHQPESVWPLAVLGGCMLAMELGRVRSGEAASRAGQVVARMGVVVGISLGAMAHWLLPYLALRDEFVGSLAELTQGGSLGGIAGSAARELGIFLNRSGDLEGAVSFDRVGVFPEFFYLSWVCVALTVVTIGALARGKGDVRLTGVLVASAVGVWTSSGAVALARSGADLEGRVPQLVVAGAAAGLLLGAFVKRLHLGRLTPVVLLGGAVLIAALPYLSPLREAQGSVPVLASLRFPRFHLVAALGLALGAAYPVRLLERWMVARPTPARAQLAPLAGAAAALVTAAAFLVDVAPYRSHYRAQPPAAGAAYAQAARTLASEGGDDRVAVGRLDPRPVTAVLAADREVAVGWPHKVAGEQVWRLAGEPYVSPPGYREAAYGLTGTKYLAIERPVDAGTATETIPEVALLRNPRVLPLVRAYDAAVPVRDPALAPVLAASLAHRNVAVVTGGAAAATLERTGIGGGQAPVSCEGPAPPGGLGGEVGIACAVDAWMGPLFAGYELTAGGIGVGAVFPALAGDLQGVSVWLDRPADRAELALHDVAGDGRTLGPERARAQAVATDEYGLTTFPFDRIPDSAGRRFAFVLTCPGCPADGVPRMVTGPALIGPGNLVDAGRLVTDRIAAFAPLYQRLPRAAATTTTVRWTRPSSGEWRVDTSGTRPTLVVVAESRFPGWRATVDGRPAPVLEADGAFVGVPVEAGDHVVTLEFRRPAAATAGRLATGATLLTIVVVGARRRHRKVAGDDVPPPASDTGDRPLDLSLDRPTPGPAVEPPKVPEPVVFEVPPEPLAPAPVAPRLEKHAEPEPDELPPAPADELPEFEPQAEEPDDDVMVVELVEPSAPKKGAHRRRRR